MNKLALSIVACLGLTACETSGPGTVTVAPGALARGDDITAATIAPSVSPSAAVSAFDTYCGRFRGNPSGTRSAVQSAGYFLLGTASRDGLEMWANDQGQPLVATGRRDGAEVCMVLFEEGQPLDSTIASYVQQKHGPSAASMGSMRFGADTAENLWIVPSDPPIIYFTLVQTQPGLGDVEAIAVVTE